MDLLLFLRGLLLLLSSVIDRAKMFSQRGRRTLLERFVTARSRIEEHSLWRSLWTAWLRRLVASRDTGLSGGKLIAPRGFGDRLIGLLLSRSLEAGSCRWSGRC